MADEWLEASKIYSLFMQRRSLTLQTLHLYAVVGNWFMGIQLLGIVLMGLTPHPVTLFIYAGWVAMGFLVRGRIQDIARECGGIWTDGDFTVPK